MVVPDPTADLVVIESDLTVARLEHLLDPVPLPLHPDQLGPGDLGAGIGQGVVDPRLAHRTDHDQPLLRPDPTVLLGPDTDRQRIDQEWPLLAAADGNPFPPRFRLARRPAVGPLERHRTLAAAPGMTPPGATPL